MNKEEVLGDFLKGLRIVLNNASAYSKDHPYFIKSVEAFKQKAEPLFNYLNPIKIEVAPDSLFLDGRAWGKIALYVDLASLFHLRKIKSIEFRGGITAQELADFLSAVAQPTKEILRQGGMQNILSSKKSPHILVEALDYSELLRAEGEEVKDVWVYLFRQALEQKDQHKITEFADNFERIITHFKAKDLSEDEELRQNVQNFLSYLKDKEKDKFYHCTKDLLKFALKDRSILKEEKLDKIKAFFKDLNKEDLTEIILEGISQDDSFNYVNLAVFSRLFDEDIHKEIAPRLEKKIRESEFLKTNPKIRKKLKELFRTPESSFISGFYRHALAELAEARFREEGFTFDQELARRNYRYILLNLLAQENDAKSLSLIASQLLKESQSLTQEKDWEYLKNLWEILEKKINEDAALAKAFEGLERYIGAFLESAYFAEGIPSEIPAGLEYFLDKLKKSYLGFNYYWEKIFNEGKVNPDVLRLFLRFFPGNLGLFYARLEEHSADIDFQAKVVKSLEGIEPLKATEVLKKIFSFAHNLIKIDILKAMQKISYYDEAFLFPVLEKGDTLLKKEALAVLAKDERLRKTALEKLLSLPSPFGMKNKLLMEHINIAAELDLRDAKDYLALLGKRPFFWNRNLRQKASSVLKEWHAG